MAAGANSPVKVLFICIGNSCRSPMAEAIARQDAADIIEATSAGLSPFGAVAWMTKSTLEANGYSAQGLDSKAIAPALWDAADLVINMSGRAREKAFHSWEKVEDWRVEDPYGADAAQYQRIFGEIERRIAELAEKLRRERETPQG